LWVGIQSNFARPEGYEKEMSEGWQEQAFAFADIIHVANYFTQLFGPASLAIAHFRTTDNFLQGQPQCQ
jgi:hypothetical protein